MYVAQKKDPTPGKESGQPDRALVAKCPAIKGRPDYSKFVSTLQGIPGYKFDEFTAKLLQKKKFLFDDWLKTAVAHKFITKLERRVLEFLADRTLRYGKTSEIVTRAQFLGGFVNNGVLEIGPAVSNTRQWYQAIHSLWDKGAVACTRITDGVHHYHTVYTLYIDALLSMKGEVEMSKLKVSKKYLATAEKNDTTLPPAPQCQNAPLNVKKKTEITEVSTARTRVGVGRVRRVRPIALECTKQDVRQNVLAAIDKANARVVERREAKVRKDTHNPKSITMTSLNATWQKVMIEAYGSAITAIGVTMAEFGIFKSVIRGHHIQFSWEDFLRWCIQSWRFIEKDQTRKQDYARKMDGHSGDTQPRLPQNPSLSAIVRRFAMFAKRYTDSLYIGTPQGVDYVDELAATRDRFAQLAKKAEEAERALATANSTIHRLSLVRGATDTEKRRMAELKKLGTGGVAPTNLLDDDELPDWPMEG